MRLAELSNNSGGIATTFEKIFGHHGLPCDNGGREHDEIEKEKQQETFIFVCLKCSERDTLVGHKFHTRSIFLRKNLPDSLLLFEHYLVSGGSNKKYCENRARQRVMDSKRILRKMCPERKEFQEM